MIRQDRYSIIEVEQLLGIPRTKIRYYMDRGLFSVSKDDKSGYYFYTFEDIMRISQIIYYREKLGFALEEVGQLLETTDIGLMESMADKQLGFLNDEVQLRNQQRKTLIFNREMIKRHQKYKDHITLSRLETAYLFPFPYYFMLDHKIYPITYGASEFGFSGQALNHKKRWVLVFERDAKYIGNDALDCFNNEGERIEGCTCVYSTSLTTKSADDPSLIKPAIDWADEHNFYISGRIFVTYFFPYFVEDTTYMYIETYLPIKL
ncbi:MAG: MerR family transcriptional regulator [Coriobacteriia bacterium]|nr:MerR family transcriptional regulator [Coriobacteriia bacterium]